MAMQERLRNLVGWQCQHLEDKFEPHFGFPAALEFGGAGSAGSGPDFARKDHVHPMPAMPDPLFDGFAKVGIAWRELMINSNPFSGNAAHEDMVGFVRGFGSTGQPLLHEDDLDVGGLFAGNSLARNALAAGDFGMFMSGFERVGGLGGQSSQESMSIGRMIRVDIRACFGGTNAGFDMSDQIQNNTLYVGGLLTSTLNDLSTITDGVFFKLEAPAVGAGEWRGAVMKDGAGFSRGTNVPLEYFSQPGPNPFKPVFQHFTIFFNHDDDGEIESIDFAINGEIRATLTSADGFFPGRNNYVCGWGIFAHIPSQTDEPFRLNVDGIKIQYRRIS